MFLATDYALCMGWIAYLVVATLTDGQGRILGGVFAAVWTTFAASTHKDFARTLAAWQRDEPCRPVSRGEWAVLAWQVLGGLVIGLGVLP